MTTLYIVRHGQTDWNAQGRIQGQKDSQLTEEGRRQAYALAQELKSTQFDAVFSSDLSRARETASILTADTNHVPTELAGLRERSHGSLEGYLRQEAREKYQGQYDLWDTADDKSRMVFKIVPDVESMQDTADRFTAELHEIIQNYQDKTLLLVTHGATMRAFLVHVGLASFEQLEHLDNTAYIVIESEGETFNLVASSGIRDKSGQGLDKFPKKG